jgi:hypothetical protein
MNGKCSNKNCGFKTPIIGVSTKPKKTKVTSTDNSKKTTSNSKSRRSSKCITYKISELEEQEQKKE